MISLGKYCSDIWFQTELLKKLDGPLLARALFQEGTPYILGSRIREIFKTQRKDGSLQKHDQAAQ